MSKDERRLLNVKDVESWSYAECQEQIEIRAGLIKQMVGVLYPSILQSEIAKIRLQASRALETGGPDGDEAA